MHEAKQAVTFHVSPGAGELLREQLGYSQAVRIGDRVEISGQGGWDDTITIAEHLDDEITAAFDNVARVLAEAGADWTDVVGVNSYHKVAPGQGAIDPEHNVVMAREFRARTGGREPIWTQTGVPALALDTMNIEIRVTAVVGSGVAR